MRVARATKELRFSLHVNEFEEFMPRGLPFSPQHCLILSMILALPCLDGSSAACDPGITLP